MEPDLVNSLLGSLFSPCMIDAAVSTDPSDPLLTDNEIALLTQASAPISSTAKPSSQHFKHYNWVPVCISYSLVKQLVEDLQYFDGIDPNACFSYGCTIGDGSDTDHLLLNFTSLSWLHNIEAFKDHHAIAIVSHETEDDYRAFFDALQALCKQLCIQFEPKFIVQDASLAEYNAVVRNVKAYLQRCMIRF